MRPLEKNGMWFVRTPRAIIESTRVVTCAGLYSDRVARRFGAKPKLRIVPFRGEYYEVAPARQGLARGLIYPVPDPDFPFLGVHFTRTIEGDLEIGPNAIFALSREGYGYLDVSPRDVLSAISFKGLWKLGARYWRTGLMEVFRSLSKRAALAKIREMVPAVRMDDLQPGKRGVRAQAMTADGSLLDDFAILQERGCVHVLNAPSPAATASLSIGESIADQVELLDG